ncbi:MAG TPA: hypothetical protein VLJ16_04365, partial [Acidobacteriota bacterium]|nr:hypothetical protein [Acidobacteriota bacterium]
EAAFSLGVATVAPRDLNDGARGFADAFGAQIGIPAPTVPGSVLAGVLSGIELNYRFSPRLAVGLAADYMKGANRSAFDYIGDVTTATVETRPAARAVPVKLVARYYPARGVYVRGGIGFYAVKVSYLYRVGWPQLQEQWRGAATASAVGGEVAFGGEWEPAARTALFIEAGFRYARFTHLTGQDVYTNAVGTETTIGTLYRWNEQDPGADAYTHLFILAAPPDDVGISDARAAVVNLSGAAIRAGVRYRF